MPSASKKPGETYAILGQRDLRRRVRWLAGDVNLGVPAPTLDGNEVDDARGAHAGQMAYTLQHGLVEVGPDVVVLVASGGQIDFGGENVPSVEAEVGIPVARDLAQQRAGEHQQNRDNAT